MSYDVICSVHTVSMSTHSLSMTNFVCFFTSSFLLLVWRFTASRLPAFLSAAINLMNGRNAQILCGATQLLVYWSDSLRLFL